MAICTMSRVITEVAEKMGFVISVLMGGPDPAGDGEITTWALHNMGHTNIASFEQWMNSGWEHVSDSLSLTLSLVQVTITSHQK